MKTVFILWDEDELLSIHKTHQGASDRIQFELDLDPDARRHHFDIEERHLDQ